MILILTPTKEVQQYYGLTDESVRKLVELGYQVLRFSSTEWTYEEYKLDKKGGAWVHIRKDFRLPEEIRQ